MTEKNYNPKQKEKKAMKKQELVNAEANIKNPLKKEIAKEEKVEEKQLEIKKEEKKKLEIKKVKKDFAFVQGKDLPISTKVAGAIGRFIKHKKIEIAIKELEEVITKKKAIPMKGEIPHRKGKIMSGRFPKRASEEVIILLKSLKGNTITNDLDEPIIKEVISNKASRPMGKRGSIQKKRTHMKIIAKEAKLKKDKMEEKK